MSTAAPQLGSIPAAISRLARRVVTAMTALRRRQANARARAICPVDSWAFTPLYSNGACPICGWRPDGYVYRPPLLTPYERYWGALGAIAAISALMAVIVILADTQS